LELAGINPKDPPSKKQSIDITKFSTLEFFHDGKLYLTPPPWSYTSDPEPTARAQLRVRLGSPSRTATTFEDFREMYQSHFNLIMSWNTGKLQECKKEGRTFFVALDNAHLRPIFKMWMKANRPYGVLLLYLKAANSVINDFPLLLNRPTDEAVSFARRLTIARVKDALSNNLKQPRPVDLRTDRHLDNLIVFDTRTRVIYLLKSVLRIVRDTPFRKAQYFKYVCDCINRDVPTYKLTWNKSTRIGKTPEQLLQASGFTPFTIATAPATSCEIASSLIEGGERFITNAYLDSQGASAHAFSPTSIIQSIFTLLGTMYKEIQTTLVGAARPLARVFTVAIQSLLPFMTRDDKVEQATLIARHFALLSTNNSDMIEDLEKVRTAVSAEIGKDNIAHAPSSFSAIDAITNALRSALGYEYDPLQLKRDSDSARQMSSILTPTAKICVFLFGILMLLVPKLYEKVTGSPWSDDEPSLIAAFEDANREIISLPTRAPSPDEITRALEKLWTTFRAIPVKSRSYVTCSRVMTSTLLTTTRALSNISAARSRVEPVCLILHGDAGIGKTVITPYIANALNSCHHLPYSSIWQPVLGSPYHDSFAGQNVTYFEDFLQEKDQTMSYASALSWFAMMSSVPYPMNCAELERKTTTFFSSRYVLISTNVDRTYIASLVQHPDAAYRRQHFIVTPLNFRGHETDHNAWRFRISPDSAYYAHVLAEPVLNPQALTFADLVGLVERAQRTHQQHFDARINHTPAFLHQYPPGDPRPIDDPHSLDPQNRAHGKVGGVLPRPSSSITEDSDVSSEESLLDATLEELYAENASVASLPDEPFDDPLPSLSIFSKVPPPIPPLDDQLPPAPTRSWFARAKDYLKYSYAGWKITGKAIVNGVAGFFSQISESVRRVIRVTCLALLGIFAVTVSFFGFRHLYGKFVSNNINNVNVSPIINISGGTPAPVPTEDHPWSVVTESPLDAHSPQAKDKMNQPARQQAQPRVVVKPAVARASPFVTTKIQNAIHFVETPHIGHYSLCIGGRDYLVTDHLVSYGKYDEMFLTANNVKYAFKTDQVMMSGLPDSDVYLIRFPATDMHGVTLPQGPNIVNHFYNGRHIQYGSQTAYWLRPNMNPVSTTVTFQNSVIGYTFPDGTLFQTVQAGRSEHKSLPGDCGSIYMYDDDGADGHIIGMLVAGNTNGYTFYAYIDRSTVEMLQRSLDGNAHGLVKAAIPASNDLNIGIAAFALFGDEDDQPLHISYISGRHPYERNPNIRSEPLKPPPLVEACHMEFYNPLGFKPLDTYKSPAAVSQRVRYNKRTSFDLGCDPFRRDYSTRPPINQDLLDKLARNMFARRYGLPGDAKLSIITFEDALYGCRECRPIDPNSSCGFPMNQMKDPKTGKKFQKNGELYDAVKRTCHPLLKGMVLAYLEDPEESSVFYPFIMSLKAELIDPEKAANGKARVFFAGSLVRTIADRMLFAMEVHDAQGNHNVTTPHSVGCDFNNPYSVRPILEALRMNPDAEVLQYDVKRFDTTQWHEFNIAVGRALAPYYTPKQGALILRHFLARKTAFIAHGERVYEVPDLRTSGEYITLWMNSINSALAVEYAFHALNIANELLFTATQGDDMVTLKKPSSTKMPQIIAVIRDRIKWELTTPQKTTDFPDAYTFDDLSFCKRTYVNGHLVYPWEVLSSAGGWRKKNLPVDTALQSIGDMLREARHYHDNDLTYERLLAYYIAKTKYKESVLREAAFANEAYGLRKSITRPKPTGIHNMSALDVWCSGEQLFVVYPDAVPEVYDLTLLALHFTAAEVMFEIPLYEIEDIAPVWHYGENQEFLRSETFHKPLDLVHRESYHLGKAESVSRFRSTLPPRTRPVYYAGGFDFDNPVTIDWTEPKKKTHRFPGTRDLRFKNGFPDYGFALGFQDVPPYHGLSWGMLRMHYYMFSASNTAPIRVFPDIKEAAQPHPSDPCCMFSVIEMAPAIFLHPEGNVPIVVYRFPLGAVVFDNGAPEGSGSFWFFPDIIRGMSIVPKLPFAQRYTPETWKLLDASHLVGILDFLLARKERLRSLELLVHATSRSPAFAARFLTCAKLFDILRVIPLALPLYVALIIKSCLYRAGNVLVLFQFHTILTNFVCDTVYRIVAPVVKALLKKIVALARSLAGKMKKGQAIVAWLDKVSPPDPDPDAPVEDAKEGN